MTARATSGVAGGARERYRLVRRLAAATSSALYLAHDQETSDRVAVLAISGLPDRLGVSAAHQALFADRQPLRLVGLARWVDFWDHAQLRHSETARTARGLVEPGSARRGGPRTKSAAARSAEPARLELDPLAACAIVLEWPDGEPVHEPGAKPLAPKELARVTLDLARLVDELHARDQAILLHPSQLRWRADGEGRRVLVAETDPAPVHPAQLAARLHDHRAYLAPEVRAGARADRRTDLYALGATLFTLATGSPPPESPTSRRGHARLALPAGIGSLAELLGKLLAADPAERLGHAGELVERLGARPARRAAARGEGLLVAPLVGRHTELVAIEAALAGGGPGAVFVRGSAGSGKSTLLAAALASAGARRVASAAFAPQPQRFDAAYAALAQAFELPARPPADPASPDALSRTTRRVRAFDRLGRAIGAAAARAGGAVVALDDVQLAGDWGLQWVEHLIRQAHDGGHSVRFVCAVSDHGGDGAESVMDLLVEEGLAVVVELAGLDSDALATLVGNWLGTADPPARLALALGRDNSGNPLAARELLSDAIEAGRVYRDGAAWVVDAPDPSMVALARDFDTALRARWARLRESERVVVLALASAPAPCSAVELGDRLGRPAADIAALLARLERAGWLERSARTAGFGYAVDGTSRRTLVAELASAYDAGEYRDPATELEAGSLTLRMHALGHASCPEEPTHARPAFGGTSRFHRQRAREGVAGGRFLAALEDAEAAVARAVEAEDYRELALAGLEVGLVLRAMGDTDGARARADHALVLGRRWRDDVVYAQAEVLRGRVLSDDGAHLGAVAALEAAARALAGAGSIPDAAPPAPRHALSRVHLELADALVRAGAPGRATRELARYRASRAGEQGPSEDQALEALVAAEVARIAGDLVGAREILERARADVALSPDAEEAWRTCLALGQVLALAGDPEAAATVRAQAEHTLAAHALALGPERGERYLSTGRRLDRGLAVEVTAVGPAREAPSAPRPSAGEATGYATLLEINKQLALEEALDPLLARIMDTAIELLGAERGVLVLGGDEPGAVALARDYQRRTIDHAAAQISRSIVARVIATGQPLLSTDASEDDRLDAFQSVSELRLRSVLCVPLEATGQRLGALYLDNRFERGIFATSHRELLGAFAGQAALAIARARLTDENRRRAEEIASLNQQLAQQVRSQGDELVAIKAELEGARGLKHEYGEIVGRSDAMRLVLQRIDRATEHALPVFVHGESGTGKELVARAIHANGPRRAARFVVENCAAVAESLLEAELFGYVRGAFTGATHDKPGLFELADGGTIFLDEVGDMSVGMQKSLLRVLQEGEVRRVGGAVPVKVDARVISASNKDLAKLVASGEFREDLYYRLDVLRIDLPPLRDRRDDVPELVERVLEEWARTNGTPRRRVSRDALGLLVAHDWPGNVRELRNAVMGALSLADGDTLSVSDFALKLPAARRTAVASGAGEPPMLSLDDYTRWFVERFQGELNDTELAKKLGISRKTLWEKRKRFGIAKS